MATNKRKISGFDCRDYSVAWICAVSSELAASRAMLDRVHADIATDLGDSNIYEFGSIGPHNIVMACLGTYGTNNAAHVATNMTRSFPSLRIRLMVGIGGGAPGEVVDIRLGDVVVGQRVMQYDMGKIGPGGQFTRAPLVSNIHQELSTALSRMKAIHESEPSIIPQLINAMIEGNPSMVRYGHPAHLQDRLFISSYNHDPSFTSCEECDVAMLKARPSRSNHYLRIHYGAFASGNSVWKDGITRDKLARELDIICFEMESAGFIGHFPCLSIRGICDYSDSHKSDDWQLYAAAVAAAYGKEFLLQIHKRHGIPKGPGPRTEVDSNSAEAHQKKMMDLLAFHEMHVRRSNIRSALPTTCEWFPRNEKYQA